MFNSFRRRDSYSEGVDLVIGAHVGLPFVFLKRDVSFRTTLCKKKIESWGDLYQLDQFGYVSSIGNPLLDIEPYRFPRCTISGHGRARLSLSYGPGRSPGIDNSVRSDFRPALGRREGPQYLRSGIKTSQRPEVEPHAASPDTPGYHQPAGSMIRLITITARGDRRHVFGECRPMMKCFLSNPRLGAAGRWRGRRSARLCAGRFDEAALCARRFCGSNCLTAELYYVRDGLVNDYALHFVVPVPATINELHFTWQSLTRPKVGVHALIDVRYETTDLAGPLPLRRPVPKRRRIGRYESSTAALGSRAGHDLRRLRVRTAESSNLSNIEHRAVIKYFVKKGKTPKEIFEDMVSVLQESAPLYTMVKKWARLFRQGRESCEDHPRLGRPVTVVTEENVRKIEKLVLADRRIKLWQIAEELQISKERVGEIIHEHMNMRKISARWVPKC
ncbi:Putative uncharacterized protein FLJ37770 [Eumeta japonica]|uniref:WIF domain-containing protein n=1 Tax=Eumeta variegata TaxID=151549 RepID=A0A4C1WAY4_EUMVA|nr:Putative uncharacterized protein FLJ37770 [Eumeta japonica]